MTTRQVFFVIAIAVGLIIFVSMTIYQLLSPTQRALKKAKRGDVAGAEADLQDLLRKGESAGTRATLGQVYLLAGRPQEAEGELRQAVEMGKRTAGTLNSLGWALVQLNRVEEALPIAEEAHKKAHEDFEVYCLYCGLMAENGRAHEVTKLYEFLKTTAAQIQKMNAAKFRSELADKYEFAKSRMVAAGLA
ncbi:tetratricopeptide repeat protein [Singulisphaera sp. Ch08]|uniref:Tetratricopeptide repeat protein n=1 Tax=Singulisphaera sp. Ch08 TaxID=3120278 RepID=A0AAU7C6Y5_9BACT